MHGVHARDHQLRPPRLRGPAVRAEELPVLERRTQRWAAPLGQASPARRHCRLIQGNWVSI